MNELQVRKRIHNEEENVLEEKVKYNRMVSNITAST